MSDSAHVSNNPAAMVAHRADTMVMPGQQTAYTIVNAEYELVR